MTQAENLASKAAVRFAGYRAAWEGGDNLPATGRGLDPGLTAAEMKRCAWVKPTVVCEAKFTEWTRDDRLRHPVFLGLRDDKISSDAIREKAS